jgi:hypothetical protein
MIQQMLLVSPESNMQRSLHKVVHIKLTGRQLLALLVLAIK